MLLWSFLLLEKKNNTSIKRDLKRKWIKHDHSSIKSSLTFQVVIPLGKNSGWLTGVQMKTWLVSQFGFALHSSSRVSSNRNVLPGCRLWVEWEHIVWGLGFSLMSVHTFKKNTSHGGKVYCTDYLETSGQVSVSANEVVPLKVIPRERRNQLSCRHCWFFTGGAANVENWRAIS